MLNSFFQAICRVGIFMICAQAIVHFRPREAYEKYLKLLVSAMVLIQLFLPFGSFLLGAGGQEASQALEQFKQEMEQAIKEAEENAAAADALLEQMTLVELRNRVEEQKEEKQSEETLIQESGNQYGEAPEQEGEAQFGNAAEDGGRRTGNEMEENNSKDNAQKTSGGGEAAIEIETVVPVRIGTSASEE